MDRNSEILKLCINTNLYPKHSLGRIHFLGQLAIAAVKLGHPKIFQLWISTYPDVLYFESPSGQTPTIAAARFGPVELLQLCIDTNPDILIRQTKDGRIPAIEAARSNNTETLACCLNADSTLINKKDK